MSRITAVSGSVSAAQAAKAMRFALAADEYSVLGDNGSKALGRFDCCE
jgi:hypothetical protein